MFLQMKLIKPFKKDILIIDKKKHVPDSNKLNI